MSEVVEIAGEVEFQPRAGRSLWSDAFRRLRRDKGAVVCFAIICVYAAVAIIAPFVLPDWHESYDYDNINASPSWDNWLGTDELGHSIVHKTLLSVHVSMTVGFTANIIAVPFGIILGAIAGYYGGRIDYVVVWFYTTLAAIPGIVKLMAIKFAFMDKVLFEGTWLEMDLDGMAGICIALGIISWIGTCRLVRAETMKLRELDYVLAARASGRRSFAILFRHIIPNQCHSLQQYIHILLLDQPSHEHHVAGLI